MRDRDTILSIRQTVTLGASELDYAECLEMVEINTALAAADLPVERCIRHAEVALLWSEAARKKLH